MRDRHCLQCGILIKSGKGWKHQTVKRMNGLVHDTCLDNYTKHKKISGELRKRIRERHRRLEHPDELKKYAKEYYIKNRTRIRNRNYRYYHTHAEQERMRQRKRYKIKHYFTETDNEFIVKLWPKWKTQGGWII